MPWCHPLYRLETANAWEERKVALDSRDEQ
jgi:hypothetical protein